MEKKNVDQVLYIDGSMFLIENGEVKAFCHKNIGKAWLFYEQKYEKLAQAINAEYPNLVLEFVEHDLVAGRSHPVKMKFERVGRIGNNSLLLRGEFEGVDEQPVTGAIEYKYVTHSFHRVTFLYCSDPCSDEIRISTITSGLVPCDEERVNRVVDFINRYWSSLLMNKADSPETGNKSSENL